MGAPLIDGAWRRPSKGREPRPSPPVIATTLMVAIMVVLASVLYVMVSGLVCGPTTGGPEVALLPASPTGNANEYKLEIGSVSAPEFLRNYQVLTLPRRFPRSLVLSLKHAHKRQLGTSGSRHLNRIGFLGEDFGPRRQVASGPSPLSE